MQQQVSQPNNQAKSLKTLFHQKGNRFGKIEARIAKLQNALAEVAQSWPIFVQRQTDYVSQQHQRYVAFQQQAQNELNTLQQELQLMLADPLGQNQQSQAPVTNYGAPTYQVSMFANQTPVQGNCPAHGIFAEYAGVPTRQPMEVDQTESCLGPQFQLPNIAEAAWTFAASSGAPMQPGPQVPVLPVQMPHVVPCQVHQAPVHGTQDLPQATTPVLSTPVPDGPPPGDWEEPIQMFPNPLYKSQLQPQQTFAPTMQDQSNADVTSIVQQAAQALAQLPPSQGGTGGQGLTPQQQQQLAEFAAQQQQCQQQLQAFKSDAQQLLHSAPVQGTPNPASVPATPVMPHAPVTPAQQQFSPASPVLPVVSAAFSVHSSPEKGLQVSANAEEQVEHFQMSPAGQRVPKVAKTRMGPVHSQSAMAPVHNVNQVPVPGSPVSSMSPTPVPTEIAESDADLFLDQNQSLQHLE